MAIRSACYVSFLQWLYGPLAMCHSPMGHEVSFLCLIPPLAIRSSCYVLFLYWPKCQRVMSCSSVGHKIINIFAMFCLFIGHTVSLLCLILPLAIMSICCMFYSFTVCQVMCLFVMLPHWHHDFLSFKLPSSWENKGQESHVCHRWNNWPFCAVIRHD